MIIDFDRLIEIYCRGDSFVRYNRLFDMDIIIILQRKKQTSTTIIILIIIK